MHDLQAEHVNSEDLVLGVPVVRKWVPVWPCPNNTSDVWENDTCTISEDSHFSLKPRKMVFLSFLILWFTWIPKTSGMKLLIVVTKKEETIKILYVLYMLIKKWFKYIFLIISLLVCTNFKSAYLSIKLFYSNSHKLLSLLCTPNEMIKTNSVIPKTKNVLVHMLKNHSNTEREIVLLNFLYCLIFKHL